MSIKSLKRCLFFIGDFMPSEEEEAAAFEFVKDGFNVSFRNVNFVADEGAIEDFATVGGLIPDRYALAFAEKIATVEESVERMQALAAAEAIGPDAATPPVIAPPAANTPAAPDWLTKPAKPLKPAPQAAEWKPNS